MTCDDLVRVVVKVVVCARTDVSQSYLLRLVHEQSCVPASVKDEDVLAALTVAVTQGFLVYRAYPIYLGEQLAVGLP